MKPNAMIVLLLAAAVSIPARAQRDSLLIVSWNVENFFDWTDSGAGESDATFSENGERHWTKGRFYSKCNGIAKTLLLIGSRNGRIPDAVAFMEIENRFVLSQIVNATVLRKLGFSIVLADSHDHRGIDCGLIYRRKTLELAGFEPKHLLDSLGGIIPTRDILVADFGSFSLLVNHHPSKVGGKTSSSRTIAMDRMNAICDSLESVGRKNILCVGDFNDDVWKTGGKGTIKYNGGWEKIDGYFSRGKIEVSESIFDDPSLSTKDTQFGGTKPLRTYSGPRYLGGISDHYPIVLKVIIN